jgi:methylated-DNA-[protein]-cysteine S-methyltransferase
LKNLYGTTVKTGYGSCGAVFNDRDEILRLLLPAPEAFLTKFLRGSSKKSNKPLENAILSYFEANNVDFSQFSVQFEGISEFRKKVYKALRRIKRGELISYRELSIRIGSPGAARAVGTAMARNPVPLIIPCHRVIRSDGEIGEFTSPGGTGLKCIMQNIESSAR